MLSEECAQKLQKLIEAGVFVRARVDRFETLFQGHTVKKCTCTSCADGDRIGRIVDRLYDMSGTRNIHTLTTHGGVLPILPNSPLLVVDNVSNQIVDYELLKIKKAQTKLDKGKIHLSLMHFPCGAAKEVGLSVEEQCQLYYTAVEYNLKQLEMERGNFFLPVHIEWRKEAADGTLVEELYIFKKTAWVSYCETCGITPTLDVEAFNMARFGKTASSIA
jgi:hypothetical protein